jgi:NAD(P)H dehydrogenase (quinone)
MNAVSDFILSERPPELALGIYNFLLTIQPEAMTAAVQRSADSAVTRQTVMPSTSRWMSSGGEAGSQRRVDPQTKGYLEQNHVALTIEMWAEALLRERPQDCLLFSQNLFQAMVPPRLNPVSHGLHANSIDRSIDPDRSLRSDDSDTRNSTGAPSEGDDGGHGNDGTPDAKKNDEARGSPNGSPSDRSPLSPSPISFMASMSTSSFEPILPLPLKLRPSRLGSPHANASGSPIPTVLVAYFSVYGHAEKLAESVAEGARTGFKKVAPSTSSLNGAVVIRQIPDLYSAAQRHQVQHSTVVQSYPTLTLEDVRNAQGLVLAFPAKFGIPPAPVLALLEELMVSDRLHGPGRDGTPPRNPIRRSGSVQTSPPGHQRDGRPGSRPRDEPQSSLLLGKVAAVAVSTATQHGGQEEAAEAVLGALVSLGCLAIGPSQPLEDTTNPTRTVSTVAGGGPLGAGTIAGIHGERDLDAAERVVAEGLGARVAKLVHQLYG